MSDPTNRCLTCGHEWNPRTGVLSRVCPHCRKETVEFIHKPPTFAFRDRPASGRRERPKAGGGMLLGCLIALGVFVVGGGVLLLIVCAGALGTSGGSKDKD